MVMTAAPREYREYLARRLLKEAHLLRWRPWPHARRTGSTPRVRLAGAASHLDLFEQPAGVFASCEQAAERGPSASLAPLAARSTYREYASRAAGGRRLASGPF